MGFSGELALTGKDEDFEPPLGRMRSRGGGRGRRYLSRVVAAMALADRHYLIVDALDGRANHIQIGAAAPVAPLAEGAIVRVSLARSQARPTDLAIAAVAPTNEGRYNAALHRRHDPSASDEFIRAHARRLEAIRDGGGVEADGSWRVPVGHLVPGLRRAAVGGAARAAVEARD